MDVVGAVLESAGKEGFELADVGEADGEIFGDLVVVGPGPRDVVVVVGADVDVVGLDVFVIDTDGFDELDEAGELRGVFFGRGVQLGFARLDAEGDEDDVRGDADFGFAGDADERWCLRVLSEGEGREGECELVGLLVSWRRLEADGRRCVSAV